MRHGRVARVLRIEMTADARFCQVQERDGELQLRGEYGRSLLLVSETPCGDRVLHFCIIRAWHSHPHQRRMAGQKER